MPIPLLVIAAAAAAASAIAKGAGKASAANKMKLTPAQQAELDDLERRQANGELGLDENQRTTLEQQFLASQAAARRDSEVTGLQQAAAQGLGSGVSGRDVFLREALNQASARQDRQSQNVAIGQADIAQSVRDLSRIDQMNAIQKSAEAEQARGISEAVSGGLAAIGGAAGSMGSHQQGLMVNTAGLSTLSDEEIRRMLAENDALRAQNAVQVNNSYAGRL